MRSRQRSGVLLAGGTSSRFGSPKGLAPFGDARLADRPLAALHAVCDEVFVASNDPRAAGWFPGIRVVSDVHDFRGGLSALATACVSAMHDTVVVCGWDMPYVTAALMDTLASAVDRGARCCVPTHADGSAEPMCAAYDAAAAVRAIADIIATAGDRSAWRLPHALAAEPWSIAANLNDADAERIFSNVNTPDDLERAKRWLSQATNT